MKPLIKWSILQRRTSLIWWTIGITALNLLNLLLYPSFRDQAAELNKSLEQLPDAAKALVAGSGDFVSPVGYLNSQILYLTLPLMLGILAISLGSSLIAKEEREGTIELLLSRPISRSRLLAGKALAGAVCLLIITLVAAVSIVGAAKIVDLEVGVKEMFFATALCGLLALSWGAVAFAVTMVGKSGKAASVGIATLYAFGGYIVSSLAVSIEWLRGPSRVFPFYYYRSEEVLRGVYAWRNALFIVGVIVICGVISWLSFNRRDIGN